jgi:3',5'-cyclic AMP phosphodiesterase CpdA
LTSIKLAVLSDLHAAPKSSDPKGTEVKLYSDDDMFKTLENPMASLYELIRQENLSADFVVCPGDMTNRADAASLRFVWAELHKLRQALGATEVIATVGNHDVDSRGHEVGAFPRESLMRLSPRFPIATTELADHFWAHGYYLTVVAGVRFLVINSCWLHESRDAVDCGAVTEYSLEKMRHDLRNTASSQVSIAVCHHHPHVHSELALGGDIMLNGQQFLTLLSETGQWLVVHGHKHHPKIDIAQGELQQPIVLACGSFSGRIEGPNATVSHNYFHMVTVSDAGPEGELWGNVQSWNWASGLGWRNYGNQNPGFPSQLGFGYMGHPRTLARSISGTLDGRPLMRWDELLRLHPELAYVTPKRLAAVITALGAEHNIIVAHTDSGLPFELGVRSE